MTTLTDRYVTATLRRVPEKQRPEIEKELRAAIADDVDARLDAGDKPDKAEYNALNELGDPYRLAASYTNHSLTLIGPDFYPAFVRSLKIVLAVTLPIVYVVLVVISFAQHKNVFASIFGPLGSTIAVGIYVSFAVTLLFALVERGQARSAIDKAKLAWSPDALAVEIEPPSMSKWGDAISSFVGLLFIVGFLLVDRFAPFVKNDSGHPVAVLDQHLWRFWIPVLLTLLVLNVVIDVVKLSLGRWTVGVALAETALGILGAAALIVMVLTTQVINPQLVSDALVAPGSWICVIVAIAVGIVWLSVTINLWRPSTRRPQ